MCPVCGSDKVVKEMTPISDRVIRGPEFSYQQENYVCNNCSEEGDFAQVNDAKYLEAYNAALTVSVKQLVTDLSEKQGISMALFERSFELPVRTLTRWKNGEFSATAVALLRTVMAYPWLMEVAENRFEANTAKKIVLREGWKVLCETMEANGMYPTQVSIEHAPPTILATAEFVGKTAPRLSIVGEQ